MTNGNREAKLARLGAFALMGQAFVVLLIWLVIFWAGSTNRFSGLDDVQSFLTRLSSAVPAAIIIAAQLALAKQLLSASRTGR